MNTLLLLQSNCVHSIDVQQYRELHTNFWMGETFINPHWGCCCCCCCDYVILAAVSFVVVVVAIFAAEMTSCSCLRLSFKCLINSNAAERTKGLVHLTELSFLKSIHMLAAYGPYVLSQATHKT